MGHRPVKILVRAFLYGVGFVAGAGVTGALIGYGLGKLAEKQVGKLLREASTPDSPSMGDHCRKNHVPHDHLPDKWWCCADDVCYHETERNQGCTTCGVPHSSTEPHYD
jgi:hypothetical protein